MNQKSCEAIKIDVTVDVDDINAGARKILEILRPEWEEDNIEYKLLTDGITNKLVACRKKDLPDVETILVRVYGNKTDLLIDRKAETRNIILLNKHNLAPNLYGTFNNGLAYAFVPGRTLNHLTVRDPKIYKLVARNMAKLHKVPQENHGKMAPCLWKKTKAFFDLVPEVFTDSNVQKRFQDMDIPKSRIQEEMEVMQKILVKCENPVVFCHNDLLLGNVIFTETNETVTFIDYEYAAPNYQAYDIGNHFVEFVGLNEIDYEKYYPNKELQIDWIQTYLEEFLDRSPSIEEIEKLYKNVNKFGLASHIFWGIWSLIQAEHSYIDFDFVGYAGIRFNEYFLRKNEFLSL